MQACAKAPLPAGDIPWRKQHSAAAWLPALRNCRILPLYQHRLKQNLAAHSKTPPRAHLLPPRKGGACRRSPCGGMTSL